MPAQQAFLGDLTGSGELRKAINLNIMILQISRILGPAMAGVVVARLGTGPAFWLNGLSFGAVIVSLILVRAAQQQRKAIGNVNPLRQIAEGVEYVRTQPRMVDLFIVGALLTFCVFAIIMNILPAVADKLLKGDAETLGALLASSGAGALFAVIFVVPITQAMKRSGRVMNLAIFWIAAWLTVFANSRSLALSMFALGMGSMGAPTVMTMAQGLLQLMAPPQMRGRIISLFTTVSFGMQPIAAMWVGQIAEHLGVAVSIQINAILLAAGGLGLLVLRPAFFRWVWADPGLDKASEAQLQPDLASAPPLITGDELPAMSGD
jgi:MFS family permease